VPEFWEERDKTDGKIVEDGEEIKFGSLRRQNIVFPLICCDCGLTHAMVMKWNRGVLTLKFYRQPEITERIRETKEQYARSEEFAAWFDQNTDCYALDDQ
jgi:hypothetical protein